MRCGSCRQNVYNVEALTHAEALRLISSRGGRACLRLHRRPDGTLVTQDCRSRLRAARRRGLPHLLIALFLVGWAEVTAMVSGFSQLRTLWRAAEPKPQPLSFRGMAPIAMPGGLHAHEHEPHVLGEGRLSPKPDHEPGQKD